MDKIPDDILRQILLLLHDYDLYSINMVCREFNRAMDDNFWRQKVALPNIGDVNYKRYYYARPVIYQLDRDDNLICTMMDFAVKKIEYLGHQTYGDAVLYIDHDDNLFMCEKNNLGAFYTNTKYDDTDSDTISDTDTNSDTDSNSDSHSDSNSDTDSDSNSDTDSMEMYSGKSDYNTRRINKYYIDPTEAKKISQNRILDLSCDICDITYIDATGKPHRYNYKDNYQTNKLDDIDGDFKKILYRYEHLYLSNDSGVTSYNKFGANKKLLETERIVSMDADMRYTATLNEKQELWIRSMNYDKCYTRVVDYYLDGYNDLTHFICEGGNIYKHDKHGGYRYLTSNINARKIFVHSYWDDTNMDDLKYHTTTIVFIIDKFGKVWRWNSNREWVLISGIFMTQMIYFHMDNGLLKWIGYVPYRS